MLDQAQRIHQRSHGLAELRLLRRGEKTRIDRLWQSGSAKVFVHPEASGRNQAVFLNTSGGLTGGDQIRFDLSLADDVALTASTQTAERAYASTGADANVGINLELGRNTTLDWLPQETLLYEHSALRRKTSVRMQENASLLLWEMTVIGRQAMGEAPKFFTFRDQREVFVADRPLWSENVAISPQVMSGVTSDAVMGTSHCFATMVFVDQAAEAQLTAIRALLDPDFCTAAASAWRGRLVVRMTGADAWKMRFQFAKLYTRLRASPLPRVWQMNGDIQ